MALLLDTQIILWLEENPDKLSNSTKEIITKEADILFSKVSVWEIAIKIKTGKLSLKNSLADFVNNFQRDYKFNLLDISLSHICQTEKLELHHKDPFDRLLIAQAIIENIPIISSDAAFDVYGVQRIW